MDVHLILNHRRVEEMYLMVMAQRQMMMIFRMWKRDRKELLTATILESHQYPH